MSRDHSPQTPETEACALISTDDDIPSGSTTAGALYTTENDLGRKLLTSDVLAVARGFRAAGYECVHVLDSHDEALDHASIEAEGFEVLRPSKTTPWTWPFLGPMTARYAVAALVGFHSPAGSDGFRPHTINDSVKGLRINGRSAGEVVMGVLSFSAFGIPLGVVTGDMNATDEGAGIVPDVEGVTVRWRDERGEAQTLGSDEAAAQLRSAAERAAKTDRRAVVWDVPVRVELSLHSRLCLKRQSKSLGAAFVSSAQEGGWSSEALGGFSFDSAVLSEDQMSWEAPNPLAAFVSIAVAASHLRGGNNWESVTEGYRAYKSGHHAKAIEAYGRALQENPCDVATHCRLGAAYLEAGDSDRAFEAFSFGMEHFEDIGGAALKSWCALGLASVERARGHAEKAASAARVVLSLPEHGDRHEKAREILSEVGSEVP